MKPITLAQMKAYETLVRGPGLFSQNWFCEPALVRAEARIDKYLPYFDGTLKDRVPDALDFKG